MTTDCQIKPIQRGSGAGGFEDPGGGSPGSKATVFHAIAPWSTSPWRKWRKNRERKEAGWQSPPSAECCAVLGTRCICARATPKRGDGCGLRCRPSQQPFAPSNAEHVFYRNGARWAWVRVLLSSMSPSHTLSAVSPTAGLPSLACYMALVGSVCPQEAR